MLNEAQAKLISQYRCQKCGYLMKAADYHARRNPFDRCPSQKCDNYILYFTTIYKDKEEKPRNPTPLERQMAEALKDCKWHFANMAKSKDPAVTMRAKCKMLATLTGQALAAYNNTYPVTEE